MVVPSTVPPQTNTTPTFKNFGPVTLNIIPDPKTNTALLGVWNTSKNNKDYLEYDPSKTDVASITPTSTWKWTLKNGTPLGYAVWDGGNVLIFYSVDSTTGNATLFANLKITKPV